MSGVTSARWLMPRHRGVSDAESMASPFGRDVTGASLESFAGGMRERPNRMVSKTIVPSGTVGSNPTPSAKPGNPLRTAPQRLRAEGRPDKRKCSRRKVCRMAIAILLGVLVLVAAGLVIAVRTAQAARRDLENLEGE